MLKLLGTRIKQGNRTTKFPKEVPVLPVLYQGLPHINADACRQGCQDCIDACPTQAISVEANGPQIDLGRCLFCRECTEACPENAIEYTLDYRMATRTREAMVVDKHGIELADAIDRKSRALFGHSLKLRQVSAGGCNACEAEVNALGNIVFDIGRFGIQMVASPRHADGLLITGPITQNMQLALLKTYAAVPSPKLVIAIGGCAISGGPFRDQPQVNNGADSVIPVDLYVPGCPPHPVTILDGLLRLLGRI